MSGAVREGKQHHDHGDGKDTNVNDLEGAGSRKSYRVSVILYQQGADECGKGQGDGKDKHGAIAESVFQANTNGGGDGHAEGLCGAIKTHAEPDLVLGQQDGKPGGHADGTKGKAGSADNAGDKQGGGRVGNQVTHI